MKKVISTVLLAIVVACCFSSGTRNKALAAFHQQEIEKQQQLLSIDRPVNDNENRKTIPKTLSNLSLIPQSPRQQPKSSENGTQTNNIQGIVKAASDTGQAAPSTKGTKQQLPTVSSISVLANHRQHPTQTQQTSSHLAHSTPLTAASVLSSTTASTLSSSPSSPTTLSSTTSSSLSSSSSTTTTTATATGPEASVTLANAASTISSVRAEPPPELGLKLPQQSLQQVERVSQNSKQQRPKQPQAKKAQHQHTNQRASNDIEEPAALFKTSAQDKNNKQQQNGEELIDRMSTSQSVSFTEPDGPNRKQFNSRSDDQKQQQQQPAHSQHQGGSIGGGNRWTHFGARLRPLGSGSGDHYETATSNSKAQTYKQQQLNLYHDQPSNHQHQQSQQYLKQQLAPARAVSAAAAATLSKPLDNNQVNNVAEDNENDDEQDSEALLYKMLQQQNFLPSPNWQQEASLGSGNDDSAAASGEQTNGRRQPAAPNGGPLTDSSKRMINLLKSYSHIHQVDDSDDQIRGTGTRLAHHRPPSSTGSSSNSRQTRPPHPLSTDYPASSTRAHHNGVRKEAHANTVDGNRNNPESANQENQENQLDQPEGEESASASQEGEASSAEGAEDEFECPNNGIFADEASGCQAYHVCQSGAQVQQKFQCPMGTLFNNIILTCDFAHNVQCGKASNKPPQPAAVAPAGVDQSDTIFRQKPLRNAAQTSSIQQVQASSRQQQQPKWVQSRPQQSSGPRQLTIGPKYIQQSGSNNRAQASPVAMIPKAEKVADASSDDERDDEALAPLVPATLPPVRPIQPLQTLPYNAPPSRNQQQQYNYQSAHRSQYPPNGQQPRPRPVFLGDDSASAMAHLFVNRDEIRSTEATSQLTHPFSSDASLTTGAVGDQGQSYNLVINHVAPTRLQLQPQQPQQQQQSQQLSQPMYLGSGKQKSGDLSDKFVGISKPQTAPKLQPAQKNQKQTYNSNKNTKAENLKSAPSLRQTPATGSGGQPQQQQQSWQRSETKPNNYDIQRQQQATQPKSVYANEISATSKQPFAGPTQQQVSAKIKSQQQYQQAKQQQQLLLKQQQQQQHQQQPQRGLLVDLTNDKSQTGVSSETLNEGMLLLLRHGNQDPSSPKNKAVKHRPSASTSQAIVVDPGLVSANAPVDAQLFPNVQMLLNNQLPSLPAAVSGTLRPSAATQSQPVIVQAPSSSTSSPVRLVESEARVVNETAVAAKQDQHQLVRVSATQANKASNRQQSVESHQVEQAQRSEGLQKATGQQANNKKPVRRVKRLKSTQLPAARSKSQEKSAELAGGSNAGPTDKLEVTKKQSRSLKTNSDTNEAPSVSRTPKSKGSSA